MVDGGGWWVVGAGRLGDVRQHRHGTINTDLGLVRFDEILIGFGRVSFATRILGVYSSSFHRGLATI